MLECVHLDNQKESAMREVTLLLEDDNLCAALEAAATKYDCSVQEITIEAVKQWLLDMEQDELEMAEIEAASQEWWKNGGVEANGFFDRLKRER